MSDGNTQPIPMISLPRKTPKPRIFTAKTLSTLRSSRQVRISCLALRSLRLCGEDVFMLTNGGDVNAWLSETGKSLRYAFALKGQNEIAQGNALGK